VGCNSRAEGRWRDSSSPHGSCRGASRSKTPKPPAAACLGRGGPPRPMVRWFETVFGAILAAARAFSNPGLPLHQPPSAVASPRACKPRDIEIGVEAEACRASGSLAAVLDPHLDAPGPRRFEAIGQLQVEAKRESGRVAGCVMRLSLRTPPPLPPGGLKRGELPRARSRAKPVVA